MIIQKALSYPFKSGGWFGKLLILGLGIFLIYLPLLGYAVIVARQVSDGDETLPSRNLSSELALGVQFGVAIFIYSLLLYFTLFLIPIRGAITYIIAVFFVLLLEWVAITRWAVTNNFGDIINIPKNLELIAKNPKITLSYYVQFLIGFVILAIVLVALTLTIVGAFVVVAEMGSAAGYLSGSYAREVGLSWRGGRGEVKFEG